MKILFLVLLAIMIQFHFGLDSSLIERDLYKDLGLKSGASLQEIKKAFRKLAQVHHPDKSKPSNKEANEVIFREVAAAYEVLSDSSQRQEYDSMRSQRGRRSSGRNQYDESNQRRDRAYRNQQQNVYNDNSAGYDDEPDQYRNMNDRNMNDFPSGRYHPSFADTILPANQVIFPYTPIILSPDRQHFALLDIHCSLGVYKGDAAVVTDYLLFTQRPPDLSMLPVELKFRTEGDKSLNGRCFAGLDETGVLRVYRGHPEYPDNAEPLWSSDPPAEDPSSYNMYFQRFYLELSSSGELAVRMLVAGSSESQCVWSTTSCNVYVALLKEMRGQVSQMLSELSGEIRELLKPIIDHFFHFYEILSDKDQSNTLLKSVKDNVIRGAGAIWDFSVEKVKILAYAVKSKVSASSNSSQNEDRGTKEDRGSSKNDGETGAQRRKKRRAANK